MTRRQPKAHPAPCTRRPYPSGLYPALLALLTAALQTVWAAAPSPPPVERPLSPPGRLFFTPAERAAIDQNLPDTPADGKAPVAQARSIRFDGVLRSRGAAPVIWINGTILKGAAVGDVTVLEINGQTLVLQDADRAVRLKPGQRYDKTSGTVRERWQ